VFDVWTAESETGLFDRRKVAVRFAGPIGF
jgi:hypothetical protein